MCPIDEQYAGLYDDMLQTNPSRVRYIKEGGICTSRPSGWVGYLAELRLLRWVQNDPTLPLRPARTVCAPGLRLSLENS